MEIANVILACLLIIAAIALVVTVLFQSGGRSSKLSQTIAGGSSDNYIGKNKQRAKDRKLSRATTIIAIIFAFLVLATSVVIYYRVNNPDQTASTDTTVSTDAAVSTNTDDSETTTVAENSEPTSGEDADNADAGDAEPGNADSGDAAE